MPENSESFASTLPPRAALTDVRSLTTEQLYREIENLRQLIDTRVNSVYAMVETIKEQRAPLITLMDTKADFLHEKHQTSLESWSRLHEERARTLDGKFLTIDEKFKGIALIFDERKQQLSQATTASNLAISAAFEAGEKANDKASVAFQKRMDELGESIQHGNKTTDDKINDLKDRVTGIEQRSQGANMARASNQETRTDHRQSIGLIIAIAVAFISLSAFVVTLVSKLTAASSPIIIERPLPLQQLRPVP